MNARQQEGSWCRRVVLQESVNIPARSQVDVPCKVVSRATWRQRRTVLEHETRFDCSRCVRGENVNTLRSIPRRFGRSDEREKPARDDPYWQRRQRLGTSYRSGVEDSNGTGAANMGTPEFIEEVVDRVHDSTPESAVVRLHDLLCRNRQFSANRNTILV